MDMDNIIIRGKDASPPFQVRTSGMVNRVAYHSSPGTKEGDIMLNVFLAGRGIYHTSDGNQQIRRGMIGLIMPDNLGLLTSVPEDPYIHCYCRFRGSYAVFLAEKILKDRKQSFFEYDNFEKIAEILKKMGYLILSELPSQMGRRELLLAEALLVLAGNMEEPVLRRLSSSNLRHYLESGMSKPTDLNEISEYFSVSKATLCRKSRKYLGATIQKYHEQIKMEWAKELFKFGIFTVKDVAYKLGYSDPLYFSRIFKRYAGQNPLEWKKTNAPKKYNAK